MGLVTISACAQCRCMFSMPEELYRSAKCSPSISFYCPFGHSNHYPAGETEAEKFRRERDLLAQRVAEKDDEIKRQRDLREGAERRLVATRGVVTRIKNRVGHGVCPCCTRSFSNLARHMASKHADYAQEAAE